MFSKSYILTSLAFIILRILIHSPNPGLDLAGTAQLGNRTALFLFLRHMCQVRSLDREEPPHVCPVAYLRGRCSFICAALVFQVEVVLKDVRFEGVLDLAHFFLIIECLLLELVHNSL